MRPITMVASGLLLAAPLVSFGPPAQADNGNNFVGQAQRLLNNRDDDRGYDRGRDNEMRRPQAERDGYGYRRDDDRTWNSARGRDDEVRRQQAERDRYQRNDDRAWNSDDRDRPGYSGDRGNYR
jgi:hypothetical protein